MNSLARWVVDGPTPGGKEAAAQRMHGRVTENFTAILRAWNNRDADAMRPYVSRGYLARTRDALDALDSNFQISHIEVDRLHNVAVERPGGGTGVEPVRAYLAFLAHVWLEDLRTGEALRGNPDALQAFTQRWTMVYEIRHGWVTDRFESVWTAPATGMRPEAWSGLPPGWYSTQHRPSTWRQWDGANWVDRQDTRAGSVNGGGRAGGGSAS